MKKLILPALAALALSACAATAPASHPAPPDIASLQGKWQQVNAGDSKPYTLEFAEGRVGAWAGCNRLSGPVSIEAGKLKTGMMISTMMACVPPLDQRENALKSLLSAQPEVALQNGQLALKSDKDTVLFARQ
ncbi:META domain-containing protein [uncultured Aquitalea sp.]|uniref:META domain-containing protein n=1 Tax=uncultured Aquitalea sp. TaxID=540272 RepID=UPI0025FF93F4|nr:META domain-containing protein [uncultured Aquitalea sp.]